MSLPTSTACPVKRERILAQVADDELVLLDLDSGSYFALNDVGARVWELCDGEHSLAQITDTICSEFDAPRQMIQDDVSDLLEELLADRLVGF